MLLTDNYWVLLIANAVMCLPFPIINALQLGFIFGKTPDTMQGRITVTLTVPAQALSAFCSATAGSSAARFRIQRDYAGVLGGDARQYAANRQFAQPAHHSTRRPVGSHTAGVAADGRQPWGLCTAARCSPHTSSIPQTGCADRTMSAVSLRQSVWEELENLDSAGSNHQFSDCGLENSVEEAIPGEIEKSGCPFARPIL